jgi:copper homeostasis protein
VVPGFRLIVPRVINSTSNWCSEVLVAKRFILEISVQTVEAAQAAERGGADRIELCADLAVGGLTPSQELLQSVRRKIQIPIFSMIRPRAGDFVYSATEFAEMKGAIAIARESAMNGVVLGILRKDRSVDVARTHELVELARPLPVTFHRAFDECSDLLSALEDVIETGAKRILTSGGAKSALDGAAVLKDVVKAAGDRIIVVPAAGISAANIAEVVKQTGAREFHSGLGSILAYHLQTNSSFGAEVWKLADQLLQFG